MLIWSYPTAPSFPRCSWSTVETDHVDLWTESPQSTRPLLKHQRSTRRERGVVNQKMMLFRRCKGHRNPFATIRAYSSSTEGWPDVSCGMMGWLAGWGCWTVLSTVYQCETCALGDRGSPTVLAHRRSCLTYHCRCDSYNRYPQYLP